MHVLGFFKTNAVRGIAYECAVKMQEVIIGCSYNASSVQRHYGDVFFYRFETGDLAFKKKVIAVFKEYYLLEHITLGKLLAYDCYVHSVTANSIDMETWLNEYTNLITKTAVQIGFEIEGLNQEFDIDMDTDSKIRAFMKQPIHIL